MRMRPALTCPMLCFVTSAKRMLRSLDLDSGSDIVILCASAMLSRSGIGSITRSRQIEGHFAPLKGKQEKGTNWLSCGSICLR